MENVEDWHERSIAIDGMAGTGKSTLARLIAQKVGLAFLDTGATYRSIGLLAIQNGLDLDDGAAVCELAKSVVLSYVDGRMFLNGSDVSGAIRTPEVAEAASQIAVHPCVREFLSRWQTDYAQSHGGAVLEGRDIGTKVLPKAKFKVFLVANPEVRLARRREVTSEQLSKRDLRDSKRVHSPLAIGDDAIEIDTSNRTIDDLLDELVTLYGNRFV
ncbi:(d)CMP kinase [Acidithrix ferrooxidans]|uniref:Cytidylate kinase n=1 Tax=Acidithrix ferrooxidans TaxID=1280514 RepID=A0A0D8HH64_9ACTN|nr:(d)CMP kinase [Acidithrix ferrooxidans]KJF17122.1 cytidylate kinase [Acidithrix ferrooxidans]